MRTIQMEASKRGHRLFRNNTGKAWVGEATRTSYTKMIALNPNDVLLRNARPFHSGLTKGSSDLIGWTSVTYTGESGVHKRLALFSAVEVKTSRGRVTSEQQNFIRVVNEQGGLAIVARSVEDLDQLHVEL